MARPDPACQRRSSLNGGGVSVSSPGATASQPPGASSRPRSSARPSDSAAESRRPIAVEDVTVDDRFAWVRGFDVEALAGMLSVPLVWHDDVVGVLNVQTRDVRRFT